jgi:HAD superfamily hydrolase (TIGR01509 family)
MSREEPSGAAIFDLDGVLVDSEGHHGTAWRRLCLEEGVAFTEAEVLRRTLGRPVRESLPELLGRPIGADEVQRLISRKAVLYEEACAGRVTAVHGAVDFVRALCAAGVPRGLATSALPERVTATLAALGLVDAFLVCVTGHDVRLGKPDPEVYLTAAARLGVESAACVAFEDAPAGVVAARKAGMRVVGVATTCSDGELRTAGARLVIRDFAGMRWEELATLLSTLDDASGGVL